VSERDFIKRFFGKRLVLMSMQSRFPALAGTAKDEFARRVEQAILDFDARAFDVSGDKHSLERTIISFVLPNMDAVRNYRRIFTETRILEAIFVFSRTHTQRR
jgi:hypothetical protein